MIWLLVIIQIIFIHINWWGYNAYYMQPKYNHPRVFYNPVSRWLILTLPWIGEIGLVILAFLFTAHPWMFFLYSVVLWVLMGYRGYKSTKNCNKEGVPPITTEELYEENIDKDFNFINPPTNSDKLWGIEIGRAICIKCGSFKSAALGRCLKCNFAPEISLDAAKSVLLTIEHFSYDELLGVSENIIEFGIGKIVFPANTINNFINTVEDKKLGHAYRGLLDMNILETQKYGKAVAENILGWRYMHGHGVQQNYRKAFELWTSSAKQGNAEAQYNLGKQYSLGNIVPQDYTKAVELLTKAGEQGMSMAQEILGIMYLKGDWGEYDQAKGITWLTKAANQGNEWAKGFLSDFNEAEKADAEEADAIKSDYGLCLIKNGVCHEDCVSSVC